MNTVRAAAPFDDASIAPHGQKLLGNFQYTLAAGETGTVEGYVSPGHNSADVGGAYKLVDHGKDISATIKPSQTIRLDANGNLTGAATGTWIHRGANLFEITMGGTIYYGALSRQFNPNARRFVVTFTAQSSAGISLWGARTGD
jgi:arabinan endo-1,5-alpha-L-arabinosidase